MKKEKEKEKKIMEMMKSGNSNNNKDKDKDDRAVGIDQGFVVEVVADVIDECDPERRGPDVQEAEAEARARAARPHALRSTHERVV
jgi:hypothetical protein